MPGVIFIMTAQDSTTAQLKRTPLYEQHRALGARLVEFGGWEMPVQYSGILQEHEAVRTRAGLFDVSHMGEFKVEGTGALAFLQYLVPNDVARLAVGQALYTQLCLPDGGTIDDLLVYHLADMHYMLVVNAANIAKDFAWVQEQAKNFQDVQITDQSDTTALIALQGPVAQAILQPLTEVDLANIRYYHFAAGGVNGINCIISRTGTQVKTALDSTAHLFILSSFGMICWRRAKHRACCLLVWEHAILYAWRRVYACMGMS